MAVFPNQSNELAM